MEIHKNLLGAALYMVEAASKKDSEPRTKSVFITLLMKTSQYFIHPSSS